MAEGLRGQHLRDVLSVRLSGEDRALALDYTVDREALDQKLHLHAFLCVVAYLLATLVHLTALRDADFTTHSRGRCWRRSDGTGGLTTHWRRTAVG